MGLQQLLRRKSPSCADAVPEYLKDKDGRKVKFDSCVVDKTDFKRRIIERKVNGVTSKT